MAALQYIATDRACTPDPGGPSLQRTEATRAHAWPRGLLARACEDDDAYSLWVLFGQHDFRRFGMMDAIPFETPETIRIWLKDGSPRAFRMVGVIDDIVVGFAGLYPLEGRQNHVGWMTLAVHEDFRRRGVGGGLLRLLLATAATLAGLRRVQLHVLDGNEAAMALYTAQGFRVEGCHEALVQDDSSYVDAYTMARSV
ncbi:GNAT family N-acetyltransferase [Beijerinckia sp. L45]|uniref:GNAT family N-acetyltransferase n=1 Tax=Beijerinckia sp. L45 TaxID=1641855 RepID=UPI00131C7938|nr:GNAT family N-acetyltransferase [Beijerinckia sp. L45]